MSIIRYQIIKSKLCNTKKHSPINQSVFSHSNSKYIMTDINKVFKEFNWLNKELYSSHCNCEIYIKELEDSEAPLKGANE